MMMDKVYEQYAMKFTEYFLPNGESRPYTFFTNDKELSRKYNDLVENGHFFDIERLTTGMWSLTGEKEDDLIALELCAPINLYTAVLKVIEGTYKTFQIDHSEEE